MRKHWWNNSLLLYFHPNTSTNIQSLGTVKELGVIIKQYETSEAASEGFTAVKKSNVRSKLQRLRRSQRERGGAADDPSDGDPKWTWRADVKGWQV